MCVKNREVCSSRDASSTCCQQGHAGPLGRGQGAVSPARAAGPSQVHFPISKPMSLCSSSLPDHHWLTHPAQWGTPHLLCTCSESPLPGPGLCPVERAPWQGHGAWAGLDFVLSVVVPWEEVTRPDVSLCKAPWALGVKGSGTQQGRGGATVIQARGGVDRTRVGAMSGERDTQMQSRWGPVKKPAHKAMDTSTPSAAEVGGRRKEDRSSEGKGEGSPGRPPRLRAQAPGLQSWASIFHPQASGFPP